LNEIIIGIDAGTSVIKAVAFDLSGRQLADAAVRNVYEQTADGGAEQDMAATWQRCVATLTALAEKVPGLIDGAVAVAVTGQGDGTWLVDGQGEPCGPALLWLDGRAGRLVGEFHGSEADRVRYTRSGTGLAACQQGPQLWWLQTHRAEQVARARHAMHCKDWLYLKLTDEVATDPSEGVFSFGNFRTRDYDDAVIEALGLTAHRALLPRIVDGTAEHATLSSRAATATGLRAGLPVVLASVDIACNAIGAGLRGGSGNDLPPGAGCSIVGSTGVHMRHAPDAEAVRLGDERSGYTLCLPLPGEYAQMQSNLACTINIDWLLDMAAELIGDVGVEAPSRTDLIARLDGWVRAASPASLLYHPYISEAGERGPFIDQSARAGFIGLNSRHRFPDLARAVIEGLCLAARDCYEAMGGLPSEVRLSGGAARSTVLVETLAAVLEAPVRASAREEAGAAGAAMMAAVSIGALDDMPSGIDRWVTPWLGEATVPDEAMSARYRPQFERYRQARRALRPVWATRERMPG